MSGEGLSCSNLPVRGRSVVLADGEKGGGAEERHPLCEMTEKITCSLKNDDIQDHSLCGGTPVMQSKHLTDLCLKFSVSSIEIGGKAHHKLKCRRIIERRLNTTVLFS